ncbi:SMI1/KNR4 family protein [Kitasatospora sp. NPDC006697]|uniref:SMI1/KNR4 family protein n=1 Tax=Kitasatospora sp. NPDC006697 TaxID=3364020 RepID=UPI00368A4FA4
MTETFDLREGLLKVRRDRAEAWPFIAGFAAHWSRPLAPGDGVAPDELDAAERRLGVRLPGPLREAHLRFGRRADLTGSHDQLLAPADLHLLDGALVYRVENQGAACWGIPLAELAGADPGTVLRPDLADRSQERWEPWEESLTEACVEMVMSEAVHAPGELTDSLETDGTGECLGELFQELPGFGRDLRWFTGPDLLIRELNSFCVQALARTPQALAALRETVPGEWLHT